MPQPDGDIVVAGSSSTVGSNGATDFALARYTMPTGTSASASGSVTVAVSGPAIGVGLSANTVQTNSAQIPNSIQLNWTAPASGTVVGYQVYRGSRVGGEDYSSPINGSSLVVGTSYLDSSNVTADSAYFYTIKAVYSGGGMSAPSNEASAFRIAVGWSDSDIGNPAQAGTASYGGFPTSYWPHDPIATWQLQGGGAGIGSGSDQFNFASQPVTTDANIDGALGSLSSGGEAGMMFRASSSPSSAYIAALSTGATLLLQWRDGAGHTGSTSINSTDVWVKLVRILSSGSDTYTAYHSTDGQNWTQLGASQTLQLSTSSSAPVLEGLAVSSNNNSSRTTATFTNVAALFDVPQLLTAVATVDGKINLNWLADAPGANGFEIDRALSGGGFSPLATVSPGAAIYSVYADSAVQPNTTYTYEVRATYADGSVSANTNTATATSAEPNSVYSTTPISSALTVPVTPPSGAGPEQWWSNVVASAPLTAGVHYEIVASGYAWMGGIGQADADWGYTAGQDANPSKLEFNSPYDNQLNYGIGLNDTGIINGQFNDEQVKTPYWGSYNPQHIYSIDVVGTGQPLYFNFHDDYFWDDVNGAASATGSSDSSKSLRISIYQGASVPASITGTIWSDVNQNGAVDGGEAVLANRVVYLDTNGNGVLDSGEISTSSGNDGAYFFNNLLPGSYSLAISLNAHESLTSPSAGTYAITLTGGQAASGKNFGILTSHATAAISGSVWHDSNRNHVRDVVEPGLANWSVFADLNQNGGLDSGEPSTTSAADGTFTITGLPAGTYSIRAQIPSGWSISAPADGQQTVSVAEGTTVGTISLGYFDTNSDGPGASFLNDGPVGENSPVHVHFENVSGNGPFTYSIDTNNDGDFNDPGDIVYATDGQTDITFPDNGVFNVLGRVTDSNSVSTIFSTSVTVNNLVPTASIHGATPNPQVNHVVNLTSSFTDPSPVDTAAGMNYLWTLIKNGQQIGTATTAAFHFVPDVVADYVIQLIVTDKDGGASPAAQVEMNSVESPTWYFNDFQGNPKSWTEWSNVKQTIGAAPIREDILGTFQGTVDNPESTALSWSLPEHNAVRISFDLYAEGTWDGSGPFGGERFTAWIDGGPTLTQTNIRTPKGSDNFGYSYPGFTGIMEGPSDNTRNGEIAAINRLSGGNFTFDAEDSTEHFSFVVAHTSDSIKINFETFWPPLDTPESWGLDNVRIQDASGEQLPAVAPTALSAENTENGVKLNWNQVPGSNVVGYHIYVRDVNQFNVLQPQWNSAELGAYLSPPYTDKYVDVGPERISVPMDNNGFLANSYLYLPSNYPFVTPHPLKLYFEIATVSRQQFVLPDGDTVDEVSESVPSSPIGINLNTSGIDATPIPVVAQPGVAFTAPVASFTSTDTNTSNFEAMIKWGDDQASTEGTVVESSTPGQYIVSGSYQYNSLTADGDIPSEITVVILENGLVVSTVYPSVTFGSSIFVPSPMNLAAEEVPVQESDGTSHAGVSLTWSPQSEVSGYNIFRYAPVSVTDPNPWKQLNTVPIDPADTANLKNGLVTWLDKDATFPGNTTSYSYRVIAYKSAGSVSIASAPAGAVVDQDVTPVPAPANVKAYSYPLAIQLTWDDRPDTEVDNWAGWNVYRYNAALPGLNSQRWVKLNSAPITELGFNDYSAVVGQVNIYHVTTVDIFGNESEPIQVSHRRSVHAEPPPPATVTIIPGPGGTATIEWTPVVTQRDAGWTGDDLAGYNVYRTYKGITTKLIDSSTQTTTTFSDSGLLNSALYKYQVTSVDHDSDESMPASASLTTGDGTSVPTPDFEGAFLIPPNGSNSPFEQVAFSFSGNLGGLVFRSTSTNSGFAVVGQATASLGGVAYTDQIRPGIHYYYRMYATDGAGNWSNALLFDYQGDPIADQPPILKFTTLTDSQTAVVVSANTDVRGIIDDLNNDLQHWTLSLVPVSDPSSSLGTVILASGTSTMGDITNGTDAKLATISPTLLSDGLYRLQLVASDSVVRDSAPDPTEGALIQIKSQIKLGNFSLPATDLTVQLSDGQSLNLSRSYDTLNASKKGDFGYGWTLDGSSSQLRDTATVNPQRDGDHIGSLKQGDLVYITLPSGQQRTFMFYPQPLGSNALGLYYTYKPRFIPIDGGGGMLIGGREINGIVGTDDDVTLKRDGTTFYSETNQGEVGYNPQHFSDGVYQLTGDDGVVYTVDATDGMPETSVDLNGNRTNYGGGAPASEDSGFIITRYGPSDGPALDGLIHQVTSTASGALPVTYGYDSQSRLTLVQDPVGNVTQYRYDDPNHPYFITSVIDARGVRVIAVEYDAASGEMLKLTDSTSKSAPLAANGFDGVQASQTVTDLAGNSTENIYDGHGNIIREIKQVVSASGALTGYLVTTHGYSYGSTTTDDHGYPLFNILLDSSDSRPFFVPISQASMRYADTSELLSPEHADLGFRLAKSDVYCFDSGPDNANPNFRHLLAETIYGDNGQELTTLFGDYKLGKPQKITDPYGNVTQSLYDDDGNLTSTTAQYGTPQAETTFYTYSSGGDYTYTDGAISHYAGLPSGLMLETYQVRPGNTKVVLAKNVYYEPTAPASERGRLANSTDVAGKTTFYTYNADGTVDANYHLWTDPNNSSNRRWVWSETHYDADGRITATDEAVYSYVAGASTINDPSLLVGYLKRSTTLYNAAGLTKHTEDDYYDASNSLVKTLNSVDNHYDIRGNLIEVVAGDGTVTRTIYDVIGHVILATDRFIPGQSDPILATRTIYDSLGRTVETQRLSGVTFNVSPDTSGGKVDVYIVTSIANAGVQVSSTGIGSLTSGFTGYFSHTQTYFNGNGQVDHSIGPDGNTTQYTYWPDGSAKTVTIASGTADASTTTNGPSQGLQVEDLTVGGNIQSGDLFSITLTDKVSGATHTISVTASSGATAISVAAALASAFNADSNTLTQTMVASTNGSVVRLTSKLKLSNLEPDWLTISTTLTPASSASNDQPIFAGRIVKTQWAMDALGHVMITELDSEGRSVRVTANAINTTTGLWNTGAISTATSYGLYGSTVTHIDVMGHLTTDHYDQAGRLIEVDEPAVLNPADLDATNQPKLDVPVTKYTYDIDGNEITQQDALGVFTDGVGTPTTRITRFTYDELGRQTSRTLPGGETETFAFDAMGRSLAHTDFNGANTVDVYDDSAVGNGRVSDEYRFAVGVAAFNASGIFQIGNALEHTSYGFDGLGRQTLVTEYTGGTTTRTEATSYDPITGQVASITTTPGGVVHYAYDPATGQHIRTWTASNDTVYTYDGQGRLSHVYTLVINGQRYATFISWNSATHQPIYASGSGTPLDMAYTYDLNGNLFTDAQPDGYTTTYSYDALNRLTLETVKHGTTLVETFDYNSSALPLRADGLRQGVVDTRYESNGTTVHSKTTTAWVYDDLGRLTDETLTVQTSAIDTPVAYHDHFIFDLANNRLEEDTTSGDAGTGVVTYSYNSNDQLLHETRTGSNAYQIDYGHTSGSTFIKGYDANGSRLEEHRTGTDAEDDSYTWDLRGRMTSATVSGTITTYSYDSSGVRVSETTGTNVTTYLNDPNNPTGYTKAVEENSTSTGLRSYVLGLKVEGQRDAAHGTLFLITDGHGNTRELVDLTSGSIVQHYDEDAYGAVLGNASLHAIFWTPWLTGDGIWDPASGWTYNLARWRDGFLFPSMDSFGGDPNSPVTLHKYLYAGANPISYDDPSGHDFGVADLLVTAGISGTLAASVTAAYGYAKGYSAGVIAKASTEAFFVGAFAGAAAFGAAFGFAAGAAISSGFVASEAGAFSALGWTAVGLITAPTTLGLSIANFIDTEKNPNADPTDRAFASFNLAISAFVFVGVNAQAISLVSGVPIIPVPGTASFTQKIAEIKALPPNTQLTADQLATLQANVGVLQESIQANPTKPNVAQNVLNLLQNDQRFSNLTPAQRAAFVQQVKGIIGH